MIESHAKNQWLAETSTMVVVRDAAIVMLVSTLVALVVNAMRAPGIPLVQKKAYDILVPCPEPVGDPHEVTADDPRIRDSKSLVLDVRLKEDFNQWHVEGARNQPFDWLGPPVDEEVKAVAKDVAASRAQRVVVYGDGDNPDSGQEWAKLLSGARIKNVFYVKGGAPALNLKLSKPEGLVDLPAPGDDSLAPPPSLVPSPAVPPRPSGVDAVDAGKEDAS